MQQQKQQQQQQQQRAQIGNLLTLYFTNFTSICFVFYLFSFIYCVAIPSHATAAQRQQIATIDNEERQFEQQYQDWVKQYNGWKEQNKRELLERWYLNFYRVFMSGF